MAMHHTGKDQKKAKGPGRFMALLAPPSGLAQIMVFLNGAALTLVAFVTLSVLINDSVQNDYERASTEVVQNLAQKFSSLEQIVEAAGGFISTVPAANTARFGRIFKDLSAGFQEFDSLVWLHRDREGRWAAFDLSGRVKEKGKMTPLGFPDASAAGGWIAARLPAKTTHPVLIKDVPSGAGMTGAGNASLSARPFIMAFALGASAPEEANYVAGSAQITDLPRHTQQNADLVALELRDGADSTPFILYRRDSVWDKSAGMAIETVRVFEAGGVTLKASIGIGSSKRSATFRQIPFVILIFGAILTLVGTLYVRGNQIQALRLQAGNMALEKKNRDLGAEIARRERLNEALVRAERENRAIIDSVSDIIFEIDQSGRISFLSAAWERVTGDDPEGMIGKNLIALLHPQDQEEQRAVLRKVVGEGVEGQGTRSFTRLRTANGGYRAVELALSMVRRDRSGALRVVGTMTDVEERRRTERALGEAERKYRAIVENAAGGIFQITTEGQYLSANPAIARIFGYDSPEQMVREVSNASLQIYENSREYAEFLKLAGQGTQARSIELEARRRDASRIWVSANMRAVRDDGGAILYFEGSIEDVTARKKAELALREAKIQSDLANRAKSEFLANMSHELRTPLNAIIGFSEIIKNEVFGPIGQQVYWEYARDIHESGKRLLGVINQILDVSRIEAGERPLNEGIVDIEKVVGECLMLLGPRIEGASLSLENRIEGRVPRLIGEEIAVKQMLMNLISNAVKFTPAGGRITLDADTGSDGRLRLSVIDTGVGLDEDQTRKALSGFGAVDGAHNRAHSGVGLGLTLVAALIRLHGGTLELVSRKGIGTAATLVFPAKRVAASDPVARSKPAALPPAGIEPLPLSPPGQAALTLPEPRERRLPVDPSA